MMSKVVWSSDEFFSDHVYEVQSLSREYPDHGWDIQGRFSSEEDAVSFAAEWYREMDGNHQVRVVKLGDVHE